MFYKKKKKNNMRAGNVKLVKLFHSLTHAISFAFTSTFETAKIVLLKLFQICSASSVSTCEIVNEKKERKSRKR
jgi:hypothetical protein